MNKIPIASAPIHIPCAVTPKSSITQETGQENFCRLIFSCKDVDVSQLLL